MGNDGRQWELMVFYAFSDVKNFNKIVQKYPFHNNVVQQWLYCFWKV